MLTEEMMVRVGDAELFCRLYGDGSPLVLLHGFFMSGADWEPWVPELARHFRLIIPDLRGHGRSTNPPDRFTLRQSAADIFALLDQLNVGPYQAMGFSGGSMTLLHMATQQPHRLRGLVLFCPTSRFPRQARLRMLAAASATADADFLGLLGRLHPRGEQQIQSLFSQFRQLARTRGGMNLSAADLSTITARTLIIHGDRDEFFPVSIAAEIHRAIPGASLWIVPGAGHMDLIERMAASASMLNGVPGYVLSFLCQGMQAALQ